MKYTLHAVIPTQQYGNLQPSIEVEADTFEEAHAQAMPHIQKVWNEYGEKPLVGRVGDRIEIDCYVGGTILYNPDTHTYTNKDNEVYLSGSQYAKKFEKTFDGQAIASKMASKWGVEANDIRAMWQLKADVSSGFGTAIHAALELYGRYNGLAGQMEKTTHLHDHPIIKKAVESFYEGRAKEIAEYEPVIVDHAAKRAGRVDRLLITGEHRCRIQDFKTNAELTEDKLKVYWEQLDFYAGIMRAAGWHVGGLDIFHFDGSWHTFSKEHSGEKPV